MLGSMADAEDAVQETYLRWHRADRDNVSDPRAFLMTTTARICLNMLTSARARREEYVGPWLPEPVLDTAALAPHTPTELGDALSIVLLGVLYRRSSPRPRGRARGATTRRDRAGGAVGRDRRETCAAPVGVRGGHSVGRSQCADAVAGRRRARRERRGRREGSVGAERDRRRRSCGTVHRGGHAPAAGCMVARGLQGALHDNQRP